MATKSVNNGKDAINSAEIAEAAQHYLEAAAKAARERSADAVQKTQDAADTGVDVVRTKHSEVEGMVRRNPTAAVAGALGVGLLVGLALKARR